MPSLIKNKLILDLSRIIVGPYATSVLSGFGCQVIKVESPQGDPTRLWGPPWHNNTSTYFQSVNFNKKSLCLNLKQNKCRQVLYKMVQKADVLVENFVPGVTQKLKIDYQTVKNYNQKLVYCSISGYGDIGSKKNYPAFDNIIQAQTGFMHLTGSKQQPFKLGFAITDVLTGLYASNAVLAGLIYQQQTSQGIHLKSSLYQCAISSLINQSSNHLNGLANPSRLGNHHPNIVPYGTYKAKDGDVVICVGTGKQFQGLMRALQVDKQAIITFKTNQMRVQNRVEFDRFLNDLLSQFLTIDLIKRLDDQKVPCGRVNNLEQVFNSQLTKQLKMVETIGNTKMTRNPIRTNLQNQNAQSFSSDLKLSSPPSVGQHNNQILAEMIGLSKDEIDQINKLSMI